jgi:hypothetical protein
MVNQELQPDNSMNRHLIPSVFCQPPMPTLPPQLPWLCNSKCYAICPLPTKRGRHRSIHKESSFCRAPPSPLASGQPVGPAAHVEAWRGPLGAVLRSRDPFGIKFVLASAIKARLGFRLWMRSQGSRSCAVRDGDVGNEGDSPAPRSRPPRREIAKIARRSVLESIA